MESNRGIFHVFDVNRYANIFSLLRQKLLLPCSKNMLKRTYDRNGNDAKRPKQIFCASNIDSMQS